MPRPSKTARPAPSKPAAPAAPAAPRADVRIAAGGNGSWVEVRRGSKSGKLLYAGVLEGGKQLHFRGRRLWARFGAAGNLTVRANGKPVTLRGTYDKVFAAPAR